MNTKLDWNSFEPLFGTWAPKIKPFFDSGGMDALYAQLKKDSQRGKGIAPLSSNVYRCFIETPIDSLKVVMCGMAPYHTFRNGMPVADGLLMGCSTTKYPQPSLEQFYTGVEKELYNGLNLNYNKNPDVSYLAHQGVLMFNASLTTEMNKPGSHLKLWEPFMEYVFTEVIGPTMVPVVFLGKCLARYNRNIIIVQKKIGEIYHLSW